MADTKNTRSSRESGAHDNQARRKVWRPVRKLETPPAPPRLCIPMDSGEYVRNGRPG